MRKELDEKLCADFPLIFKNRHGSMQETCMCWGFECGDGWYWLIDKLCRMLMWNGQTGKPHTEPPTASQVKEKYGTLRFYVDGANEQQYNYILMAECLSGSICESCGSTRDVSQTEGWLRTRCLACHQEDGNIPYGN